MIDLYKDNHVHVCVCAFVNSLKKTSPQKLLTGLLPNIIVVFLRWRIKSSLHHYRKIRPVERYTVPLVSMVAIDVFTLLQMVGNEKRVYLTVVIVLFFFFNYIKTVLIVIYSTG